MSRKPLEGTEFMNEPVVDGLPVLKNKHLLYLACLFAGFTLVNSFRDTILDIRERLRGYTVDNANTKRINSPDVAEIRYEIFNGDGDGDESYGDADSGFQNDVFLSFPCIQDHPVITQGWIYSGQEQAINLGKIPVPYDKRVYAPEDGKFMGFFNPHTTVLPYNLFSESEEILSNFSGPLDLHPGTMGVFCTELNSNRERAVILLSGISQAYSQSEGPVKLYDNMNPDAVPNICDLPGLEIEEGKVIGVQAKQEL